MSATPSVVYLAYGRRRFTKATVFSALTLVHVATRGAPCRLVVYTDAPEIFDRYGVPCELFPVDIVRDRESSRGNPHRSKLLVIQHCADTFDGPLMFVDGDTYFMKSPAKLFDWLSSPSHSVLHTREFFISDETEPRLDKLLRQRRLASPNPASVYHRPKPVMWNSGVIGLAQANKSLLPEIIDICDHLFVDYPYHAMDQVACSLVLENETEIFPADEVVYHYWYGREELTYMTARFLAKNRGLALGELAAAAYAFQPKVTEGWRAPPTVRARQLAGRARRRAVRLLGLGF